MNPFKANNECDMFSNFTFHGLDYEGDSDLAEKEKNSPYCYDHNKLTVNFDMKVRGILSSLGLKFGLFLLSVLIFKLHGIITSLQVDKWIIGRTAI